MLDGILVYKTPISRVPNGLLLLSNVATSIIEENDLGYDTIYGYQDIKDDEIIGLKSTSIKFKGKAKKYKNVIFL